MCGRPWLDAEPCRPHEVGVDSLVDEADLAHVLAVRFRRTNYFVGCKPRCCNTPDGKLSTPFSLDLLFFRPDCPSATKAGKNLGFKKGFCTKTEHESTTQRHTVGPTPYLTKDKSPISEGEEHHVKNEDEIGESHKIN